MVRLLPKAPHFRCWKTRLTSTLKATASLEAQLHAKQAKKKKTRRDAVDLLAAGRLSPALEASSNVRPAAEKQGDPLLYQNGDGKEADENLEVQNIVLRDALRAQRRMKDLAKEVQTSQITASAANPGVERKGLQKEKFAAETRASPLAKKGELAECSVLLPDKVMTNVREMEATSVHKQMFRKWFQKVKQTNTQEMVPKSK